MPYDPTQPADFSPLDPQVVREQLAALKALIDAQQAAILALQIALAGTAQNPNVGTLSLALSEPPLRAEVQAILDFTNALSTSLTRV